MMDTISETEFQKNNAPDKARERLIKDIVNHRVELVEVGSGDKISHQEINELEDELEQASDELLLSHWDAVAEWIWSRGLDADEQFKKVVNGKEIDYGYRRFKYEHPY